MNVWKKLSIIIITILLVNGMSGCELIDASYMDTSKYDGAEEVEDEKIEDKPVYGGSITIPMDREENLVPIISSSRDVINVGGLIYEGLVKLDDELRPVPALAESWSVSEDGRIWNFKLRQGVKWHDGVDFSVQDVLFTIDVLRFGGYDTYYAKKFNRIQGIENIRAIGKDTLYVELAHPVSFFLDSFTFPIMPKHVFENIEQKPKEQPSKKGKKKTKKNTDRLKNGQTEDSEEEEDLEKKQYIKSETLAPIGTGPYKLDFETYNLAEGFTLKRNDSYWNEKPYIDKIEVKVYEDSSHKVEAFRDREIDVLDTSVVFADTYVDDDEAILHRYLTSVYEFLAINHKNPIFADINVRKALAFGIDRKSIIKSAYLNNAEIVDAPICSESWLFDGSSRIYDCDVDIAIDLLEKAGWHDTDGDGIRDKVIDGQKVDLAFKLVTNMENDLRKDAAESIRRQLTNTKNGLGIYIDVELIPWEEIVEDVIPKGKFDLLLTGHHMPEMPDLESLFGSKGSHNFIGYDSPELDELILRARNNIDDESIRVVYRDIQRHFTEQLPVISLYFPTNSAIISKNIRGKICPRELNVYRDIEKWYVSDKK